ncbi:phosphatidylserine decarboxylase family protein [Acanthopleuribacter pedis]|uniref:Phosphatidylserine decarboxylase proenzyme n=1 Tax=Acanthopleuribacter pedis TaxID=442870 RepID=A0A8J7QDT4_9BACT|nr:phosphatidylserine decarboxylase family protein [Acanthopleuribacter pedis]MBO1319181.1 phosphatidylserine decarboxylase family protein [Acanthopleuribacter pedis]
MAGKHQELVAKEGWVFLFPTALAALLLFILGWVISGGIVAVLAVYIAYFFRNPYRQIPEDPKGIVSPADGKIVAVRHLDDGRVMISVFLNIFNVHVNRSPIAGEVETVLHTPGKFLAAYKEEASTLNEQNKVVVRDGDFAMEVIQIAGLVARRIICWTKTQDTLAKGERFGLIRFGSRVDLYFPDECDILVTEGQKVSAGSDLIARRR